MEHAVRHSEVGERVDVDLLMKHAHGYVAVESEVVAVVSVESSVDCMIVVQNRGHAVEPETIDVISVNEIEKLTEKELHDLLLLVVETLRLPQRVISRFSRRKILVSRSVEEIETVFSVGGRVTTCQRDTHCHL